jgi:hypothetical protein
VPAPAFRWFPLPLPVAAAPLALPQPDWLQTTLTVAGPDDHLAAFRAAAAGAGMVPWAMDYDRLEEDWFHLLMRTPPHRRSISARGARILARQLREAAWARREAALSRAGAAQACPFDLHALAPVPGEILRLGEDAPEALAWLWRHWGTTWPLRRVETLPAAAPPLTGEAVFRVRFWSADWSPWPALLRICARWPALRLAVRPAY